MDTELSVEAEARLGTAIAECSSTGLLAGPIPGRGYLERAIEPVAAVVFDLASKGELVEVGDILTRLDLGGDARRWAAITLEREMRSAPFATWYIGAIGLLAVVCVVRRNPIVGWVSLGILITAASAYLGIGNAFELGLVGSITWVVVAQLLVLFWDRAVRDTERLADVQRAVSAWHATQLVRQRERRVRVFERNRYVNDFCIVRGQDVPEGDHWLTVFLQLISNEAEALSVVQNHNVFPPHSDDYYEHEDETIPAIWQPRAA